MSYSWEEWSEDTEIKISKLEIRMKKLESLNKKREGGEMTGKQKMALVVKHFDAILKLYPKDHCACLSLHEINKKDIDRKVWVQSDTLCKVDVYRRKPTSMIEKIFDIKLFTKGD